MEAINKNQSEMKETLIKIKNNLQGINSEGEEARNQINVLEHMGKKNQNSKKKKESKKKMRKW